MNPIQELTERFLPYCKDARDTLAEQFPNYESKIWSSSTGGETDYQGYDVGVEVLFSDADPSEAYTVSIIIGVKHLSTTPMLCDANVGWGAGNHPDIEIDLLEEPVPFTEDALIAIENEFPKLVRVLEEAVNARFQQSTA